MRVIRSGAGGSRVNGLVSLLIWSTQVDAAPAAAPPPAAAALPPAAAAPAAVPLAAGASGLVLRLNGGDALEAPVVATLVPEAGVTLVPEALKAVAITLNDLGKSPDVHAGDGMWSGSGTLVGDRFEVSVKAANWSGNAGSLVIPSGSTRGLDLVINGAALTVEASEGLEMPPLASVTGEATSERVSSGASGAGTPNGGRSARGRMPYVLFGIGGLTLATIGYVWFRGARRGGLPRGVRRMPELGIFGAGTPTLAPGLTQWVVTEPDEGDFLRFLVASVARSRPVLVQAADAVELPTAAGGPVFRAAYAKPGQLADAVDGLLATHPSIVVLTVGPAVASARVRWTEDFVEDAAVFVLVREPVAGGGAVVSCQRGADGWVLRVGEAEIVVA